MFWARDDGYEARRDRWWTIYHKRNTLRIQRLKAKLPKDVVENAEVFLRETPHNKQGVPYERDIAFYKILVALKAGK